MLDKLSHATRRDAAPTEYLYGISCGVLSAGGGVTLQECNLSGNKVNKNGLFHKLW